jgi:hypothetical protein
MNTPMPQSNFPDPATGSEPMQSQGTVTQTGGGMKQTARDAGQKIKSKASQAMSQAKERGEAFAQERKSRAADRIEGFKESLHQTAERFEREEDPNIAHYTRMAADKLEQAAAYIRDCDIRDLRHDAEDLARRHPALFFGGMFVAGLAMARFFKASTAESSIGPETSQGSEPVGMSEQEAITPTTAANLNPGQPVGAA